MAHQPLAGSVREHLAVSQRLADIHPDTAVSTTVVVRRPDGQMDADPADLDAVRQFAAEHGMTVVNEHARARSLTLAGTARQMHDAFQVDLGNYACSGQVFRGHEGAVHVPGELADKVVAVLGLDERPQARHPHRVSPRASSGYAPNQVAAKYGFPTTADGSGQTVAVIELGGGYKTSDLQAYFSQLKLPMPSVSAVGVDGAANSPGDDADVEVALDVEVIGAVAPGAKQVVYFGPNSDQGFYDVLAAAIHDPKTSVVSISWGGPESSWATSTMDAYDQLFQDAATLGVTITAASGDNGSTDGTRRNVTDFPASSPHVLACGGTKLPTSGQETVWNETASGEGATGGGVSGHFAKPSYQSGLSIPGGGRGVPDVAGCADPLTGYLVFVNGQMGIVGGTSAVAPLWAGLISISNQINSNRAGVPHAALYASPQAFTDIVSGNNGAYSAASGYDCCTGLGTPRGQAVVAALASAQSTPPPTDGGGSNPPPTDGGGDGGGSTPTPTGPPSDVPALVAVLQAFDAFARANQSAAVQLQAAVDQAISALNSLDS